ncbi:TonB-dependent receptor [Simiduia curdlanivorans]|uniref:TonB-dependent receptor n=1 Tax=Simiduia curdlanivorans TaxID=1492769 RepID=A0ABV8V345_9GAMM|nr:TonB-dependent receptor [Simiduia curdlanivorans]MDN3641038.1 TonB-dependent receptor [Simiduia curdlanivorans]
MNNALIKKPLVAALTALALSSTTGYAQVLEEVVVTAQKRPQSLQDVPVSINAIGGDKLAEGNLTTMEDVTAYVPNFSMSETGIGTQIFIRGIGSGINQAFEQSVGTYIDGIYYGRAQLSRAPFMDLERIEVLRGPQGILFGKNSIAGAINMTTAKPTDEMELKAGVLYEPTYNQREVNLVASGPLSDTVRARLAIRGYNDDGYIENQLQDRDEPNREERAIRGTITWDVTESFDVTLKAERDTFDVKGRQIEIVKELPRGDGVQYGQILAQLTGDPRMMDNELDFVRQADSAEYSDNTVDNVTITANYDAGFATLTSVTGWAGYEFSENCDCDFTGADVFNIESNEEYRQVSQEFRLVSPGGETVDWIAGVFYQDNTLDYNEATYFSETSILGLLDPQLALIQGINVPRAYEQDSTAAAIFAQATWNINEAWALTLGGRYTEEEKTGSRRMNTINTATGLADPVAAFVVKQAFNVDTEELKVLVPNAPGHNLAGERDESAFTPSVSLQWIANDDVMLYLSGSTGFKSGGFDTRANQVTSFEFENEEAVTYEFGTKTRLLDDSAELNAAVFYTEYKDLQTSQFDGILGFTVGNAKKARVQGVEIDGRMALPFNLVWTAALGYLDFEYLDFQDGNCYHDQTNQSAAGTCDYTGKESQYTPTWSGSTSLDHNYDFGELTLHSTLDLTYQGQQYIHPNLDPRWDYTPGTKVNGRIALEAESWTVALVGKNLTDKETLTYANTAPLSASTFQTPAYYGFVEAPRTIAIQANYRY